MSSESQARTKKIIAQVIEALKELQNTNAETKYILVQARSLEALSRMLDNAIDKTVEGTAKEILLDAKAGLDWILQNKSLPPKNSGPVVHIEDS